MMMMMMDDDDDDDDDYSGGIEDAKEEDIYVVVLNNINCALSSPVRIWLMMPPYNIPVPYSQAMLPIRSWRDGSGTRFEGVCSFAVDESTPPNREKFEIIFPMTISRFEASILMFSRTF